MGWIPKISIACISCMSCQQRRPISSSRQHRISTKLGMQHHIYLLSSLHFKLVCSKPTQYSCNRHDQKQNSHQPQREQNNVQQHRIGKILQNIMFWTGPQNRLSTYLGYWSYMPPRGIWHRDPMRTIPRTIWSIRNKHRWTNKSSTNQEKGTHSRHHGPRGNRGENTTVLVVMGSVCESILWTNKKIKDLTRRGSWCLQGIGPIHQGHHATVQGGKHHIHNGKRTQRHQKQRILPHTHKHTARHKNLKPSTSQKSSRGSGRRNNWNNNQNKRKQKGIRKRPERQLGNKQESPTISSV